MNDKTEMYNNGTCKMQAYKGIKLKNNTRTVKHTTHEGSMQLKQTTGKRIYT